MKSSKSQRAPMIEQLEDRTLLSHTVSPTRLTFSTTATSGTIANPISQSVAAKITSNGLPLRTATIYFVVDNQHVLGSGTSGRSGYVTLTIPNIFAGPHTIAAYFTGATRYKATQSVAKSVTVTVPSLTTTSSGLEWATITPGSGAAAARGNTVNVDYAGYIASDPAASSNDGTLFDTSIQAGRSPLQAIIDGGRLIPGFNEGLKGMKVGETRLLYLPADIAYGATPPSGSNIPVNAALVFFVKMVSIS